MIRKWRNQREIPTSKTEAGKNKLTIRLLYNNDLYSIEGQSFLHHLTKEFNFLLIKSVLVTHKD